MTRFVFKFEKTLPDSGDEPYKINLKPKLTPVYKPLTFIDFGKGIFQGTGFFIYYLLYV